MKLNYTKCKKCGNILDPNEAIEHNGNDYCIDHYEELIQDEQDKELEGTL